MRTLTDLIQRLNDASIDADAGLDDEDYDRQALAEHLTQVITSAADDLQGILDQLADYRERLVKDVTTLDKMADDPDNLPERRAHLSSKSEGVMLALSKFDEINR